MTEYLHHNLLMTSRYTPLRYIWIVPLLLAIAVGGSGCAEKENTENLSKTELQRRSAGPKVGAFLVKAQKLFHEGSYRFALALTDSAQQRAPELADVYFLKGRIFTELKMFEQAEKAYQKVFSLDPQYQGVWLNRGNNAFRRGKSEEAIRMYRRELEKYPSAQVHMHMGRAYERLGKTDSARTAYHKAIGRDSSLASAYMWLGQSYDDSGESDKALKYSHKGLALEPENLNYQYIVGSILYRQGKLEEAVGYLRKVTEGKPWHHGAHYNLGQALVRMGRQEKGKQVLAKADSLQEVDSKIEQLRSAANQNPRQAQTWVKLGDGLRGTGQLKAAMEAYQRALTLAPKNLVLHNNVANMSLALGDTTAAVRRYQMVLQQDPNMADVWLNLGVIYGNSGRLEKARKVWEKGLEYSPNNQELQAYLTKLSQMENVR